MHYSDMEAMRVACETGSWGKLQHAWLSLACPAGQLVRKPGGQWYWSLGCVGRNAVLAWPALEHRTAKGKATYSIKLENVSYSDLAWFLICELEEFESVHTQWRGPLHKEVASATKRSDWPTDSPMVAAEAMGKPTSL
eukprot:3511267-Heterocapsa_arctica.AAC.1